MRALRRLALFGAAAAPFLFFNAAPALAQTACLSSSDISLAQSCIEQATQLMHRTGMPGASALEAFFTQCLPVWTKVSQHGIQACASNPTPAPTSTTVAPSLPSSCQQTFSVSNICGGNFCAADQATANEICVGKGFTSASTYLTYPVTQSNPNNPNIFTGNESWWTGSSWGYQWGGQCNTGGGCTPENPAEIYQVTCTGTGNECPAPSSTPSTVSPTPSTKFTQNERVQTTAALNVRSSASPTASLLGLQANGALGTIAGGPTTAGGHTWWQVNYSTAPSGWSVQEYLQAASQTTSCTFNSQTVASGASVTAYQASSVAVGSSCVPQTRTCTNGTLSGTYADASCSVQTTTTPVISSLSALSAPVGGIVTAFGANFTSSDQILFNSTLASTTASVDGATLLIPSLSTASPGTYGIVVKNTSGTSNSVSLPLTGTLAAGTFTATQTDDVCYGTGSHCSSIDDTQEFDACLPENAAAAPVVLLIHGGGWDAGDKKEFESESSDAENVLCDEFAQHGVAVFNLNYRLFNTTTGANAWPVQLQDVEAAIQYIKSNAQIYNINTSKICALGTSAGSQIAALLAVQGVVQCAVDNSGPVDLVAYEQQDSTVANIFGAGASAQQAASPIDQITAQSAPILITHGLEDKTVAPSQAPAFYNALVAKGVSAELLNYTGGHVFNGVASSIAQNFFDAEVSFVLAHIGSASTAAQFMSNEQVQTTSGLNVRSAASPTASLLGTQASGALGTIAGGPTTASGYTWWQVDYANAPSGWSVQDYLQAAPQGSTAATPCMFSNQSVASGASVTAYQAATVPSGSLCVPQTRTCTSGTLSGTYTSVACTISNATVSVLTLSMQAGLSISPQIYGINYDWNLVTAAQFPAWAASMKSLGINLVRYPSGWNAEHYSWATNQEAAFSTGTGNCYDPDPLSTTCNNTTPGAGPSTVTAAFPTDIIVPSASYVESPSTAALNSIVATSTVLVQEYGNQVSVWEIGNEWWLQGSKDPGPVATRLANYAALIRTLVPAMKAVNPNIQIYVMADWSPSTEENAPAQTLQYEIQTLRADVGEAAWADVDGISIHAYCSNGAGAADCSTIPAVVSQIEQYSGKSKIYDSEWAAGVGADTDLNSGLRSANATLLAIGEDVAGSGMSAAAYWPGVDFTPPHSLTGPPTGGYALTSTGTLFSWMSQYFEGRILPISGSIPAVAAQNANGDITVFVAPDGNNDGVAAPTLSPHDIQVPLSGTGMTAVVSAQVLYSTSAAATSTAAKVANLPVTIVQSSSGAYADFTLDPGTAGRGSGFEIARITFSGSSSSIGQTSSGTDPQLASVIAALQSIIANIGSFLH